MGILLKLSNPFLYVYRRSPAKRPKLLAVTQEDSKSNSIFGLLDNVKTPEKEAKKEEPIQLPPVLSLFAAATPVAHKIEQCPVDWSLKTRIRFTSKQPFAFSSTLKVRHIIFL